MIYNGTEYKGTGGDVLTSGGFGCIFEPTLQCELKEQYKNTNINKKGLSKLMIKKNAESEYRHIVKFKSLLNKIKNYQQYFLLDNFSICKPNKLTKSDLKNFKKCKALTKRGYTKKNINNSLEDLLVINMPNGGINVEEFIDKYFTKNNIIHLNNSLIDLLVNGIIPMNKMNIYHCDIKDSNVLVDKMFNTRLIDWGLSIYYPKNIDDSVPHSLYRRPFQFNVPFSVILFNGDFTNLYNIFLKKNDNPDYFSIREFVINYIFVWNEIRGSGHLDAINSIISKFSENMLVSIEKKKVKKHVIEYQFTYYYIVEYLTKILFKITKNGKVDLFGYFNNIFIKNVDILGFTMIYVAFYEKLYNSKKAEDYKLITNKIKSIIQTFLFSNPNKLINTTLLVDELTKLNNIIQNIGITNNQSTINTINTANTANTANIINTANTENTANTVIKTNKIGGKNTRKKYKRK